MREIILDSEEVTFTFKNSDFSAIVNFYDYDDFSVRSLAIWDIQKAEWVPFDIIKTKELTLAMNEAIEEYGDNAFEALHTSRYEPTDWKDCYD
tara:strand:- start:452 stop:730 length:279 start_codon:yes stop_codon:yes gene_type:complete